MHHHLGLIGSEAMKLPARMSRTDVGCVASTWLEVSLAQLAEVSNKPLLVPVLLDGLMGMLQICPSRHFPLTGFSSLLMQMIT